MKTKKFNLPKAKRSLDRILSKYILNKHNRTCQRCGKSGFCDTAHIIPKEITILRWEPKNLLCLCKSCHKFGNQSFHKNALSFAHWYNSTYTNSAELLVSGSMAYELTEKEYERIKKEYKKTAI